MKDGLIWQTFQPRVADREVWCPNLGWQMGGRWVPLVKVAEFWDWTAFFGGGFDFLEESPNVLGIKTIQMHDSLDILEVTMF